MSYFVIAFVVQIIFFSIAVNTRFLALTLILGVIPFGVMLVAGSPSLALNDTERALFACALGIALIIHCAWVCGGDWEHENKDGGQDRRFRQNAFIQRSSPQERANAWVLLAMGVGGIFFAWLIGPKILATPQTRDPRPVLYSPDMSGSEAFPKLVSPVLPPSKASHRKRHTQDRAQTAQPPTM